MQTKVREGGFNEFIIISRVETVAGKISDIFIGKYYEKSDQCFSLTITTLHWPGGIGIRLCVFTCVC